MKVCVKWVEPTVVRSCFRHRHQGNRIEFVTHKNVTEPNHISSRERCRFRYFVLKCTKCCYSAVPSIPTFYQMSFSCILQWNLEISSLKANNQHYITICFLNRWPLAKCKVTFWHIFLIQFLCNSSPGCLYFVVHGSSLMLISKILTSWQIILTN